MIVNGAQVAEHGITVTFTRATRNVVRTGCRLTRGRWRQWCWFSPYGWVGCLGRVRP